MEKQSKKYYFYVLRCRDATFYTGFSTDVTKRVKTHNLGKGAKYTRNRRPVELIYYEEFQTKSQALKKEYAFKHLTRKQKEDYLREHRVSEEFLLK
ncbi:GIY-YIG nuclease family protein [Ligilactobacillus apodemi]|uniref:GIY-YIG domain-containing protein n=1 Tax=Ligilactobacillus apodemi DSM 16634 = JCM 16172 TaxID=1423724 RepID=A0A0R1TU58_9LACO|nr:GIY-YIG nuclease family protein [Ligilactobacillus apodemi]KRL83780.1 hypothetical protein FC32_GL001041 [Ligilactobacillus apodemi DSM 16634 = JCM 16172]MCR1900637.1 GIY-YIG nuclease family protein [Ligilactobacillus apodemi]